MKSLWKKYRIKKCLKFNQVNFKNKRNPTGNSTGSFWLLYFKTKPFQINQGLFCLHWQAGAQGETINKTWKRVFWYIKFRGQCLDTPVKIKVRMMRTYHCLPPENRPSGSTLIIRKTSGVTRSVLQKKKKTCAIFCAPASQRRKHFSPQMTTHPPPLNLLQTIQHHFGRVRVTSQSNHPLTPPASTQKTSGDLETIGVDWGTTSFIQSHPERQTCQSVLKGLLHFLTSHGGLWAWFNTLQSH